MYIVSITNNGATTTIHDHYEKLVSGKVVKGINTIDSFTFTILPSNVGFDQLHDFTTLVSVYNTNKDRYEFYGRVLCTTTLMSEDGLISKEVTCESFLGYLCDSQQLYVAERNWTVTGLLSQIINTHNSQVESNKQITLGNVTVTDPNNNLYCGIQYKSTWETIKEKLLDVLGGELRIRIAGTRLYLDYVVKIGEKKETAIALSQNMKSITQEKDPSEIITRLIPLGCKLKVEQDGQEVETGERLTIADVMGGRNYLVDEEAEALYGIHVGFVEWDDVTEPHNLYNKGMAWLAQNNKVSVKYTVSALDLSLLGLVYDDFDIGNSHPLKNPLLGIDDTGRIIKKTVDICEEIRSTFEIGEQFKTLSEIQAEAAQKLVTQFTSIAQLKSDYVTKTSFGAFSSQTNANLANKVGIEENDRVVTMLNAADEILWLKSNRLIVESDNFELSADGTLKAKNAEIEGTITSNAANITGGGISLTLNNGGHVYLGKDWNAVCIESADYDGISNGSQVNVSSGGITYVHGNVGHMPIQFDRVNGEWQHLLTGTWYISRINAANVVTSDKTRKHDIEPQADVYSRIFDRLVPVTFRYNNGTSDRIHTGFIAQDVEEAVIAEGLTTQDFAAVCYDVDENGNKTNYGVRYEEIVSMCVKEIQMLKARIAELEERR